MIKKLFTDIMSYILPSDEQSASSEKSSHDKSTNTRTGLVEPLQSFLDTVMKAPNRFNGVWDTSRVSANLHFFDNKLGKRFYLELGDRYSTGSCIFSDKYSTEGVDLIPIYGKEQLSILVELISKFYQERQSKYDYLISIRKERSEVKVRDAVHKLLVDTYQIGE